VITKGSVPSFRHVQMDSPNKAACDQCQERSLPKIWDAPLQMCSAVVVQERSTDLPYGVSPPNEIRIMRRRRSEPYPSAPCRRIIRVGRSRWDEVVMEFEQPHDWRTHPNDMRCLLKYGHFQRVWQCVSCPPRLGEHAVTFAQVFGMRAWVVGADSWCAPMPPSDDGG
jgi:hypothetical protein